jgi:hypothetical protein
MCGYCGKHEMVSHRGMEPDHFVPKRIDETRICDYSNLVYSCFTCNRKKIGKWPTDDKDKPNNGHKGFVDPATEEYNDHLGRCDDGTIEFYSEIGEYMYRSVFRFDIRPTKAIWQATALYELKDRLKAEILKKDKDEQIKYIGILNELDDLQKYLFEKAE